MLNITSAGNGYKMTFNGRQLYLKEGTTLMPMNSLYLIVDESNIATFRRSSNGDVFASARIDETKIDDTQCTKSNISDLFAATCVGSTGGGSDTSEIPAAVAISQDGQTMTFSNSSGETLFTADTTMFIADKYVKSATMSGTTLILTIDTISGDSTVSVDLAGLLTDYYTKSEIDNAEQATSAALNELNDRMATLEDESEDFALQADLEILESEFSGFSASTNTALAGKLDTTAYTQITVDSSLSTASTNPVQNAVVTTAINGKANIVQLTQSEYDALDPNYDPNTIYIITDASAITVDSALSTGSTNPVANSAVTTALNAKLDTTAYTAVTIDSALNSGSTNPVQNAIVTQNINSLNTQIGDINTILNNINGNS